MTDGPRSPKRVHILSSINPLPARDGGPVKMVPPATAPSPRSDHGDDAPAQPEAEEADERPHRSSKFRFKRSGSSRRQRSASPHRHRKRRRRPRPSPAADDDEPNPHEAQPLDRDTAFRESLFDALADDEGAAYWEGVYGQPIHVYGLPTAARGELERMTEDDYADYVRQKMWEKTHAGQREEHARREERRAAAAREKVEADRAAALVEASLARGEERRRMLAGRARLARYTEAWEAWDGSVAGMSWPVASRERRDVSPEAVRDFFVKGLDVERLGERQFAARLKEERVRWHPDKMQQRLGGAVDDDIMKHITAVFQIIDALWADTRAKAK